MMESLAWKAADRRSLDLESLSKVGGRFGFVAITTRVGLTTVNVCDEQQIQLGMTLLGAEVGLLLRIQDIE